MIDITSTRLFCSEILNASKFLENDEVGMLVNAANNYMYEEVEPSFKTKALNYAWSRVRVAFAKPTIEEAPKKRGRPKKENKHTEIEESKFLCYYNEFTDKLSSSDNVENTLKYIDIFVSPKQ